MHKRSRFVIALALFMSLSPVVTFADNLSDQLHKSQQQLQQDQKSLQAVQDKRDDIEAQLEQLDVDIEDTMNQIKEHKNKMEQVQVEIKKTEEDVAKAEIEVNKQQELMNGRLREMYKNGQASYIAVILEAKSFGDLISRIEAVTSIANYDKKIMDDLKAKQEILEKKKQELASEKNEVAKLQKESEDKLQQIKDSQVSQSKLIDELKSQEKMFASKVRQDNANVDAAMERINSIRNNVPKYVPSRGAANFSQDTVVAYAANFLGTPYVWGGTTPNPGFDCSGFVRYVYAHFGVQLGRATYDQIHNGYAVSRDQLQPGDIVFFGKNGSPTHEGMYIGNNSYIHAPHTGDVVKISSLTRSDYITARRVR